MRMRWIVAGALLAALGISGGSWMVAERQAREQARQAEQAAAIREAEQLRQRNETLAREKAELAAAAERAEQRRRELAQVVERLNVESRLAYVDILQQHTDLAGEVVQTVLRFTELDRNGEPLSPQVIGVAGAIPHFDALVVKFDKDYVARGDALRGQSLALFRRVYGETQAPESGYWLSTPGAPPDVYRVNPKPSDFERELWAEFWSYATDPAKARSAGVRVAQGEAVYAPVRPGERWVLTLDAAGGLNLIKQREMPLTREDLLAPPPIEDARLHAPSPLAGGDRAD